MSKQVNNETLQVLLNQALPTFPSFFLIPCYSRALLLLAKRKQNQQGSNILIYSIITKKTQQIHTQKNRSYRTAVSFGFSASNGQQGKRIPFREATRYKAKNSSKATDLTKANLST